MSTATIIPLPAIDGGLFEEDKKYRGITAAIDKVLDALHLDGWSLGRLYSEGRAVLPLPPGKFPPGRSYLFSDTVAVVVQNHNGAIITSLPAHVALSTLNLHTPEVLEGNAWASRAWKEFLAAASSDDIAPTPRYYKQNWFDRNGSMWTVKRVHDGARIYRDGDLINTVADADEAEHLGFHPILVEFVEYVITGA